MHTKEERLRYGQQLRKQIQLNQDKKKQQMMQKRRQNEPNNYNSLPNRNPDLNQPQERKEQQSRQIYHEIQPTQQTITRDPRTRNNQIETVNRKQMFQKQLEEQSQGYFPFASRAKGSLNTRRDESVRKLNQAPQVVDQYSDNDHQPISQPSNHIKSNQYPQQYYPQQPQIPQSHMQQNYPIPQGYNQFHQQMPPHYVQQPLYYPYLQGNQPSNIQLPIQNMPQFYQNQIVRQSPQQYNQIPSQQYLPKQSLIQQAPFSREQVRGVYQREKQIYPSQKQISDDEKVKITKGRNILQYENQHQEEIQIKNQKKQQNQRELLRQIQQKQRMKKLEQQKIRLQQLKLEQQNKRFLKAQKQRIQEQNNKKRREQQIKRENQQKNRQMIQKLQREKQEAKKKKRMQIPQYQPPVIRQPSKREQQQNYIVQRNQQRQMSRRQSKQSHRRNAAEEQGIQEQMNYQTIQKAFNTDVSREFIMRQKQKDQQRRNKDKQFNQLKRNVNHLKEEAINQNQFYKIQMQRAKLQSEKIKLEKQRMEHELERLRRQVNAEKEQKERQAASYKLKAAMEKTQQKRYEQQSFTPKPLKPKQEEQFIKKTYSYETKQEQLPIKTSKIQYPYEKEQYLVTPDNYNQNFEEGLQSLYGETVKIPVHMGRDKLTMSNIQQFDIKNINIKQNQIKKTNNSIIKEEDEDPVRRQFRKHLAEEDQLDRFVQQPKKNPGKWGDMSSIDSDATKEISRLLQQQQYHYKAGQPIRPSSRPTSKLSNVGKQSLNGNLGYAAQGFSLQSNVEGTYKSQMNDGTFNLQKINDQADRRLSKLRQMGIQTVGQDQQMFKLDRLVDNYKY